jgi:probable rRNA maturation factor
MSTQTSSICFFLEGDITHPFSALESHYIDWLLHVAKEESTHIVQLNYIFCSDEYLLEINQTYLNHDDYTDIITFPYKEGSEVEGDLFISLDRVEENAQTYGCKFEEELRRVMVHGLLHLTGHKDKSEVESQDMRHAEDKYLSLYQNPQSKHLQG